MQKSNKTNAISNFSNSTNQTVIFGYSDVKEQDFSFDEFGTPSIPDRT